MNIQEEWANLSQQVTIRSDMELAAVKNTIRKESSDLLQSLKKSLQYNRLWGRGIGIAALVAAFFAPGQMKYWLFAIFLVYELAQWIRVKDKQAIMQYETDFSGITREVIIQQLELANRILKVQEIWGYIFIPLAGPAGLILQYQYHGKTFAEIIAMPYMIYILPALLLLGIPGIYLGKKMNAYAFGKYISKLQQNLKQFEE
jgi:hypothetical protein